MIKEEIPLMQGVYDCVFKSIMLTESNIDYLKEIIHMITKIPKKDLNNIVVKNVEHLIENKNDKKFRSDIIVSIGRNLINLEMNKNYYIGLFSRNEAYLNKIAGSLYEKGDNFLNKNCVIQINFDNFNYFYGNQIIYKFVSREENLGIIYPESTINYHVDLDFIRKKWYNSDRINEASKLERYMLILTAETDKIAEKIAGDDKILENITEHLKNLNNDEDMIGLYDAEKVDAKVMRTKLKYAEETGLKRGMEKGIKLGIKEGQKKGMQEGIQKGIQEGKNEGIKEGIKTGKEEGIKEITKNMLKETKDLNFISKVTGLSINEIQKLI